MGHLPRLYYVAQRSAGMVGVGAMLVLIGFGSMAFHGTLTRVGQAADELPILFWEIALLLVIHPEPKYRQCPFQGVCHLSYAPCGVYGTKPPFHCPYAPMSALILLQCGFLVGFG